MALDWILCYSLVILFLKNLVICVNYYNFAIENHVFVCILFLCVLI